MFNDHDDTDRFDDVTDLEGAFDVLLDDEDDDTLDEYEPDAIGRAWEEGFLGDGDDLSER